MIKPDVLLTWPSGVDYPVSRWELERNRRMFERVIITFYPHGSPDFSDFVMKAHPSFKYCLSQEAGPAWRETAVNLGLKESKSDWVLFTEQDFIFRNKEFLEKVFEKAGEFDTIGIRQGSRLHPCFLLTRKSFIEKSTKDFSVKGQDQDHFTQFSKEILEMGSFADLKDLGLFSGRDWFHFSSLTWNLFRVKDQNIREMHNLPDFLLYNVYSRLAQIPQDDRWVLFTLFAESLLTDFGRFLHFKEGEE